MLAWNWAGRVFVLSVMIVIASGCGRDGVSRGPLVPDPAISSGDLAFDPPLMYFIFHSSDLTSPDWPEAFQDYRLMVCNPGMTAAEIATIRQAIPGVILLAYLDVQAVPVYCFDGPYYQAMSAAMDTSLCMIDLSADCMLKLEETRFPEIVLTQASADILVAFHRDVTMSKNWDGLYLDQCNKVWPLHKRQLLTELGVPFDIDGDREPDTLWDIQVQYQAWRPYFTSELRRTVRRLVSHPERSLQGGPARGAIAGSWNVLLVGNVGQDLVDAALNGITFEGIGISTTVADAVQWTEQQMTVAPPPQLVGGWVWKPQGLLPTQSFVQQVGGYYGPAPGLEPDENVWGEGTP